MKNHELITLLEQYDPQADVVIYVNVSEDGGEASNVSLSDFETQPYMKGMEFEEINPHLTQPFIIITSN